MKNLHVLDMDFGPNPASATSNNMRFYSNNVPRYPYEPTRDCLAIVGTINQGQGLISLRNIKPGDIVFRFHGEELTYQTLFTLQRAAGSYIEDPQVMGKVLHSCDPNMSCDMQTLTFTAIKPIVAGEYLTMDYETTEDELFRSFDCGCGAAECRGYISGRSKPTTQRSA